MKIEVTQEDIDLNGHGCHNCPVQRAIKRHASLFIDVLAHIIIIYPPYQRVHNGPLEIPNPAENWIKNYDAINPNKVNPTPVKPFSFNLSAECFMV